MVNQVTLKSASQTAREMERITKLYYKDLGNFLEMPFQKFFRLVADLPYKRDPADIETVSRPKFTLDRRWPWRDCDDKAVLIGSWLYAHGVPFRYVASSKRPDKSLHHVFIEAQAAKYPKYIDATLKKNVLGQIEDYTTIQPLGGFIMPELRTLEGAEMGLPSWKKIKRVTKKTARVVAKPVTVPIRAAKKLPGIIGRNVPGPIKKAIGAAVRATVGNRQITPAVKAVILPSATAAALAVPGAQAFAPGVPIVVNVVLDEMIRSAKKKAGIPQAPKPAALTPARKAEIKRTLSQQKQERRAARIGAKVAPAAQVPADVGTEKKNNLPLIIGGGAAALAALLLIGRKKGNG